MKRFLVFAVAVSLVLMAASASYATISGSKHDLSFGGTGSIQATSAYLSSCQFCHTPHHSNNSVTGAPLWNRTISAGFSAADGVTTYTVYGTSVSGATGVTLAGSTVNAPGTNSKTCLSCHDGTLSLGNVLVGNDPTMAFVDNTGAGRLSGAPVSLLTGGGASLGGEVLSAEHPVGVIYNSALTSAGLAVPASAATTGAVKITNDSTKGWVIYGGNDGVGTVECGSCHDPHMTDAGYQPFLKGTKNSICTDCHSRK